MTIPSNLVPLLLGRLHEVRQRVGLAAEELGPETRFADAVDSMGLVEFLALVSDDLGVAPDLIEHAVGRRFTTVANLARALKAAHASLLTGTVEPAIASSLKSAGSTLGWLAGAACRLPAMVEPAALLDAQLQRPPGWLESHAGIRQRRVWGGEDPLDAAGSAGREALAQAGLTANDVAALLVTSESPPQVVGLAATVHHRLGLVPPAVALEIGGACGGFLAALWTAKHLLPQMPVVLIVVVEAASRWLTVQPGPAGEATALFGDAAAACVLTQEPVGPISCPLRAMEFSVDGSAANLVQVQMTTAVTPEVVMAGTALAGRAIETMAAAVEQALCRFGWQRNSLQAIIAHGGNGRLPALLARQVGVASERVWSLTADTGNLGAASLPAAWAMRGPTAAPAVWTAVGAGLVWGWAVSGSPS